MPSDTPRTAVVTGASSGIGKETAKALAAQGWAVIGIGRDPGRIAAAEAEIRAASAGGGLGGEVAMIRADLSSMTDTARAAEAIAAFTDRIDLLVNSAGGMCKGLVVTPERNDANFAANHLGPFLLTNRLLPLLRRAAADAPAGATRIIAVASDVCEFIPGLKWDDLQLLEDYDPGLAYCQGKLANVLHVRGLARRVAADGIVVHAVHPGTVASNFITHAGESTQAYIRTLEALTPEQGADTVIWAATSEEAGRSSGGYFYLRAPRTPPPFVEDEAAVERLWQESERIVANAGV